MWQQAKWARLFQMHKHAEQAAALEAHSFADAVGFHTALAAAGPHVPVRYPTELASTRASELQHNAPHYLRQLELAARATPARLQVLSEGPKASTQALAAEPRARTQSLDYMESKPRSDERHPGDMDVYQTYEYYPKPEGTGFTDYDGHRLWTEMQRDYRAQHPSASTYPAVPVVFKETSEGGAPIANPLSQPVEDIYQGMGYEDNMQPPFGMGTLPEGGAEEVQTRGTMKLSPKQGFEMMKRQEQRQSPAGESGDDYSYRNPDWHDRYVPHMNADHKTFLATPSVAQPVFYSGLAPQQQNTVQRERGEARGYRDGRRDGREEREIEEERHDLRDKQDLILKEQHKLESELNAQKEQHQHAAKAKTESPAQELFKWERAHAVDDRGAYTGVPSGSKAERKAHIRAQTKATTVQELRSKQRDELEAKEQQMMSVALPKRAALDAEGTHEHNEEMSTLKATIMSMAHRQSKLTAKTDGLKNEVRKLVEMEKSEMDSFEGRLHGNAKLSASVRAGRAKERAEEAHNMKLEQQIALLKKQKAKQSENKAVKTVRLEALHAGNKLTMQNAMMTENARLNAQMRMEMKAQQQLEASQGVAKPQQPVAAAAAQPQPEPQVTEESSQAAVAANIPSAVLQMRTLSLSTK